MLLMEADGDIDGDMDGDEDMPVMAGDGEAPGICMAIEPPMLMLW